MQRYGSGRSVFTSTTTTEDPEDFSSERRIRRLRLTLVAADDGNKEPTTANSETTEKEKDVRVAWKKKNGLTQRGRPAGRESPPQLGEMTNGAPETALQNHGPKVYGVVQRTGSDRQQEVMAREWSVNHLQREMEYIREVRDSLEKVREKMYGQFGGMQQSMQSLTQEIRTANSHRRSLESEVRVRTEAMDSFDQMNSSLITANIGLQKSLIENCQRRVDTRDDVKSLRSASEKTQEKLREKEKELEAAQVENKTLRLQAQLDEYIRRLEEAETNIRIAEAKIADRDQRIIELERLLECMGREKSQFHKKLEECEQRLRLMELTDKTDATVAKKYENIVVVGSLRAKVAQKDMFISELLDRIAIVECENNELEDKLKYFMSTQNRRETNEIGVGCNLLPGREAKGHDVEPPVHYEATNLHPIQQPPPVQPPPPMKPPSFTLPVFPKHPPPPIQPSPPTLPPTLIQTSSSTQSSPSMQPSSPTSPIQTPFHSLLATTQPRTFSSNNPPPSRLDSSLLRYTPVQYSRYLQANSSVPGGTLSYPHPSESEPAVSPVQSGRDEVDAKPNTDTRSSPEESTSSPSSRPRSRAPQLTVMSSSWTERQGRVGDLGKQSKEELQELLLRQEKILSNTRFLQSLPDKGKKIRAFAEKVHLAIEHFDEDEKKQSLVFAARKELQSKYQHAFTSQRGVPNAPTASHQNRQSEAAAGDAVSAQVQERKTLDEQQDKSDSREAAGETMETAAAGASLNSDERKKDGDLVEAFERVRLLPARGDPSPSGSSSPSRSSGASSPLSAQARRERDRKHLDDITSAKMPPLIYSPAKLLSLDESASLQQDQTRRQQELYAKLAAQKLSEGLKVSVGSYTPDGGPMAAYREVHDEGTQLSSDED
ncbi:hypothetical protein F7725_026280 [Dissostichus mawsoni]|uniref:Myocardial zonula adherens protein n=1 Tax=Dissostichus mawsoni TaxID=36200 RepID=A0A7J5X6P7_DISMA|nr:hypothetical protein F7725_026280 [Dissostichus mawsoni]